MHSRHMIKLGLAIVGVGLTWALVPASALFAAEPEVVVSVNAPVPITVNGADARQLPASVALGSRLCVTEDQHYVGIGERFRFLGWRYQGEEPAGAPRSEPDPSSPQQCITASAAGSYTATFLNEMLLQVRSRVEEYRRSRWVPKGYLVELEVSPVVETGEGARFVFAEWSAGETPFTLTNRLAVVQPSLVEVRWTPEYLVEVLGPGGEAMPVSGWYPEGSPVVLRAQPDVSINGGASRLRFSQWEMLEGPSPSVPGGQNPSTRIVVEGPCVIQARYVEEHLILARNFQGTLLETWVPEGQQLTLHSPATVEVSKGQERYVFKSWDGLSETSNDVTIAVDGPLNLEATYEHQFKVQAEGPFGISGAGWYADGDTATVAAPENPQSMLFFKKLFDGFLGYESRGATWQVEVRQPVSVIAVYRNEIQWRILAIVFGGVIGALLVYHVAERSIAAVRRARRRRPRRPVQPTEVPLNGAQGVELG